ncbi:MAG TPA: hydroxymethylbilane synthase, partial [Novosphingobium sp.]|nr:hydroxymethylbilane synthase [Novosphingobium sp.]
ALLAERALLAALGGNCHSPIAALTSEEGGELALRAALFSPDGAERVDGRVRFAPGDPAGPAALAADLLARAPEPVRVHFTGPPKD